MSGLGAGPRERRPHVAHGTERITSAFTQEDTSGSLHQQMEGIRKVLIHELSAEQFADMYAQTIAYGLFAARVNVPNVQGFTREQATYDLPKTNPFLRKMFTYLAGPDLDTRSNGQSMTQTLRQPYLPALVLGAVALAGRPLPIATSGQLFQLADPLREYRLY
jgi:hypothetical protein